MIERLSTRTNANGYAYQAEVDHDLQTVDYGYFIFRRDCYNSLTVGRSACIDDIIIFLARITATGPILFLASTVVS